MKFAYELHCVNAGTSALKELFLIAPDPKFIQNDLDDGDASAYQESEQLWGGDANPGEQFALRLIGIAARNIHPADISVVYSRSDRVASWEDNVEELRNRCEGIRGIEWVPVGIGKPIPHRSLYFQLEPEQAVDDFWVHTQLLMNTKSPN